MSVMDIDTTDVVESIFELDVVPYENEEADDKAHHTHIVNPPNNLHIWRDPMTAQDIVDVARQNGWEVWALCGYHFVPKRNSDKYDACGACMAIATRIMGEEGE